MTKQNNSRKLNKIYTKIVFKCFIISHYGLQLLKNKNKFLVCAKNIVNKNV